MRPDDPATDQSTSDPSTLDTTPATAVAQEAPTDLDVLSRAAPSNPTTTPEDRAAVRALLKDHYSRWRAAKEQGEKPPVPQVEHPGHVGEIVAHSIAGWAHAIWDDGTKVSEDMWSQMVWLYIFTCENLSAR